MADTNNTPNTLAARDGSGVIRATTFAGALAGAASSAATANNAQTADALTTPRQINGTPFDGTADIKIGVPVINRGAATLSATDNGSMIAATGTQSIPVLSAGITISIWNNTSGDIVLNNSGRWSTTQARAMSAALHSFSWYCNCSIHVQHGSGRVWYEAVLMPIQQHLMGSGGSGGSVQLIGVNRFLNSDKPDPIPQDWARRQ